MTDTEAIALRANRATPGPWVADGLDIFDVDGEYMAVVDSPAGLLAEVPTGIFPPDPLAGESQAVRDAEFIAHARTDIPELLARVRLLEGREWPGGHPRVHEDDGNGGCLICREYRGDVGDDAEYVGVRFPCPTVRLWEFEP